MLPIGLNEIYCDIIHLVLICAKSRKASQKQTKPPWNDLLLLCNKSSLNYLLSAEMEYSWND